jgi:hypothetical protein
MRNWADSKRILRAITNASIEAEEKRLRTLNESGN